MRPIIEITQVSLQFSNTPALENINYIVNRGDFIILLGSNGSGKSSLLKLIDQRYQPSSGKMTIYGKSIITFTQHYHESIFPGLTLYENYLLIKNKKKKNIFSFAKKDNLAEYLNPFNPNLAEKLNVITEHLSGGEKQAFALALCFIHPPEILLLDEHTSALDPLTATRLMEITDRMVKQHQITCLVTTHDLDVAEKYGNKILSLKQGKIHRCFDKAKKGGISQAQLLTGCY